MEINLKTRDLFRTTNRERLSLISPPRLASTSTIWTTTRRGTAWTRPTRTSTRCTGDKIDQLQFWTLFTWKILQLELLQAKRPSDCKDQGGVGGRRCPSHDLHQGLETQPLSLTQKPKPWSFLWLKCSLIVAPCGTLCGVCVNQFLQRTVWNI